MGLVFARSIRSGTSFSRHPVLVPVLADVALRSAETAHGSNVPSAVSGLEWVLA